MKTKHLLFAAALPLAFAACQNEEFESAGSAELSKDQRPLVEVKLNFQKEGADTRVSYNGTKNEYGWQSTDQIGAFLMDEVVSGNRPFGATADKWAKESWLEHYKLVDYIHTDYPFSWNATTEEWTAPSKLQEGNYFFACPYETYEGQRQLIHYLDGQTQTGGTEADMNAAIAKNQYFIGYGQVKAGTGNKEALKEVIMTPVLAPVKVTLRNIGTVAKDVEKIVIYGSQVATALTVNPTDARYFGTNADGSLKDVSGNVEYALHASKLPSSWNVGSGNFFNYANLLGAKEDLYVNNGTDFVYNIASGATDYNQGDALRQTVHASYSEANADDAPAIEKQAVLSFTKPVNVAANNGEIHFAVMVNTLPTVTTGELKMDIIMTQGRITGINLTKINAEETDSGELKENTVITNNKIKSLKPGVKNELIVQFDNNSVVKAQAINVQDEATLLAFIKWNQENQRENTATLLKDVTLTKEMYTILTSAANKGNLVVKSDNGSKLLVADDVPVDVLNVLHKTTDATVVLNGTRTLTKAVADKLNGAFLEIGNQGTLNVAEAEVVAYVPLNNYGTIKVAEKASLKGVQGANNVANYGMVENLGEIYNVKNLVEGEAKGYIKTSAVVNQIAENVAGATIELVRINDPVVLNSTNAGTIYFQTTTGVKASDLTKYNVTKLDVNGGEINFDNADNSTVVELNIDATKNAVSLAGYNNSNPPVSTYHAFKNAQMKAAINGTVKFVNAGIEDGKIVAEKAAKLTFDKEVTLGDVTFINGATVNVTKDGEVLANNLVWNGNDVTNLGTFEYKTSTSGKYTVVAGGKNIEKNSPTTSKEVDVIFDDGTLKDLAAEIGKITDAGNTVGKITITTTINMSEKENSDNASKLAGQDVELGTNGSITNIGTAISMASLTVSGTSTISSASKNVPMLTVNELSVESGATLTLTDGYLVISGTGQVGIGSGAIDIKGTLNDDSGKVVTKDRNDEYIKWDKGNAIWKSF